MLHRNSARTSAFLFASAAMLVAPLLLQGCSSAQTSESGAVDPSLTSPPPSAAVSQALDDAWTVGMIEGNVDLATGKVTIRDVAPGETSNGVKAQSFGVQTRSNAKLQWANTGTPSGANANCGDPAPSGAGIPIAANSFCTDLTITNNSGLAYSLVWLDFVYIQSPASVALAATDTVYTQNAYTGYFPGSVGALAYGDIAPSAATTRKVVFRTGGSATGRFSFTARIKAAPSRGAYSNPVPGGFTNACTGGTQLIAAGQAGTFGGGNTPWPIAIYNKTGVVYRVNTEGVFYLSATGINQPTPASLPTSLYPSGSVFAFWTNQAARSTTDTAGSTSTTPTNPGQICAQTTGTQPSRKFTVTWENMKFGNANANSNPALRYSVSFYEADDSIELGYDYMHLDTTWPATLTSANFTQTARTRGNNAMVGFQGAPSGSGTCDDPYCFVKGDNVIPHASAATYPLPKSTDTPYPYIIKFTPTTTN